MADATTTIYHNPRCSKSRATLQLLQDHGITPEVVAYLDNPPDAERLHELLRKLDLPARELLRTGEPEYAGLGLADTTLDEAALVAAMVAHPRLIERPIVVHGDHAAIGRPPERVLELPGVAERT